MCTPIHIQVAPHRSGGGPSLENPPPRIPRRCQDLLAARLEGAKARHQAQALLDRSALLRDPATEEKIWIVPALYNLANGKVQFFEPVSVVAAAPSAHH